jgi:DNA-binding transcriptional ArsR family regulator
MKTHPDIAAVAALIGEPARAAMLVELLDGRALTASELAARVEIAPSTASEHLAKLVAGALLACEARGRHRHYRLAGPGVASALEILGTLARHARPVDDFEHELLHDIRFARSCYDHLAGRLGVAITESLLDHRFMVEADRDFRLTSDGEGWFAGFGVDLGAARQARRAFARRCLDWSERRPHLAGALGAGLLARLLELGWVERRDGERTLRLTPAGQDGLDATLGLRAHDLGRDV